MKLSQPTTAVTDYLLAIELCLLGALLAAGASQWSTVLWAASFLVMAVSAIAGGTYHGGRFVFRARTLQALRKAARIGIALSLGLLLAAAAASAHGAVRWMLLAASAAAVLMSPRGFSTPAERGWNRLNATAGILLLALAVLFLVQVFAARSPAGMWLLAGGLLAGAGLAVQHARLALHRHLNHDDVFHVAMMAAYYLWYRGALLLHDR